MTKSVFQFFFFQQSFFLLSNRESDLKIAKARQIRVKTAALIHVICNGRHGPIAVLLVVSAQELYICVSFWLLAHESRDLSQAKTAQLMFNVC